MALCTYERPVVLVIYNKYLQSGGEDAVVKAEIETLKKHHYQVFYKEYQNTAFKADIGILRLPFQLFFNLSTFFTTYFFVIRHKIDVVHVHNFFYTASPSVFWGAKLAKAKTVMTLHNYRLFCLNSLFFKNEHTCMECHTANSFKKGIQSKCFKSSRLFSIALAMSTRLHRKIGTWQHKVDTFITINPLMRQLLNDIQVPEVKIAYKANFVADAGFNNYNNREDFYLYAGRLQEGKGIRHLIKAFQQTGKKLYLAGDGEMADFVKAHASDNLVFLGTQSSEAMHRLLMQCKALVFPSLLLEGMPMTLIEAQSKGTIVIAASSVNTLSMITDGENGFLYKGNNVESLIEVINKFEALNTEMLNTISARGRAKYLQNYTEEQHIKIINNIYGN